MAFDVFINLGDKIKGESKDSVQGPKGDIDIFGFSWGMNQVGTFHTGGGGGGGKVSINDIGFSKYADKASGPLMQHCCLGTHIPKAVILVRKAGGKQEPYITITMTKCIISSVSFAAQGGGDEKVVENVSINFADILYEYFMQDDDGITKNAGKCGYNIEGNVATV